MLLVIDVGNSIDDPVSTHLTGIIILNRHSGFDARTDHIGGMVKKIADNGFHHPGQGRHDR